MNRAEFYKGIILLMTLFACANKSAYQFKESQSQTIDAYRRMGYYEYSSRLCDSLWGYFQKSSPELIDKAITTTLKELNEKLLLEKPNTGCYLVNWQNSYENQAQQDVIILEWNPNIQTVIIRMFTNSPKIKSLLPEQSF